MRSLCLLVLSLALVVSCSSEDEPTAAERFAALEGRELTEAEVADRQTTARFLCGLDDAVLRELWSQMDNDQLAFQDVVFTSECGERNPLYAAATGRFTTTAEG